jgi:hypothetical protein
MTEALKALTVLRSYRRGAYYFVIKLGERIK